MGSQGTGVREDARRGAVKEPEAVPIHWVITEYNQGADGEFCKGEAIRSGREQVDSDWD